MSSEGASLREESDTTRRSRSRGSDACHGIGDESMSASSDTPTNGPGPSDISRSSAISSFIERRSVWRCSFSCRSASCSFIISRKASSEKGSGSVSSSSLAPVAESDAPCLAASRARTASQMLALAWEAACCACAMRERSPFHRARSSSQRRATTCFCFASAEAKRRRSFASSTRVSSSSVCTRSSFASKLDALIRCIFVCFS